MTEWISDVNNQTLVESHYLGRWCCFDCIDYVNSRLAGHSSVTSTLTPIVHDSLPVTSPAEWAPEWLIISLVLIVLCVAIAITSFVLICVVRIRGRSRQPALVKYSAVAVHGESTTEAPAAATVESPIPESTNAAATTVAGSQHHIYAPNVSGQQPFEGFLPPELPYTQVSNIWRPLTFHAYDSNLLQRNANKMTVVWCVTCIHLVAYFGTLVNGAQPVTAGLHGVSSKKCQLEVVE